MKKRLLTFALAALLLLTAMVSFAGCGLNTGYEKKYEYSSTYVNSTFRSEFATSEELFGLIYEDTSLKLYEDGTWISDYSAFWFIKSDLDKGT